jgi:hypothetical protein
VSDALLHFRNWCSLILKKICVETGEHFDLAQDRDKQQSLVDAVVNFQVT